MFLFNKYRNSQQSYSSGVKIVGLNWKTFLNTNPPFGAESTAVFDSDGNLYFGSHSGNFYALDSDGQIQWVFTTTKKIYSSPLIIDKKIYFTGGDGFMYCINRKGQLVWKYDLSSTLSQSKIRKAISYVQHFPFTFDHKKRKNIVYRSWASPNFEKGRIVTTGYGKGLYCFNPEGELLWTYDLGFPRYQLSGVALDNEDNIYCCSRKGVAYAFTLSGDLVWQKCLRKYWEPWGNPVVSIENSFVFFFLAKKEKKGLIFAVGFNGNTIWKKELGAIRGSCALSHNEKYLVCCDLDGYIYKIDTTNGNVLLKSRVTKSKRGLWTTPTLDKNEDILLSIKDDNHKGRIIKLNQNFETIWEYETDKVLSVPFINKAGDVFFGAWDGYYYSLKTSES